MLNRAELARYLYLVNTLADMSKNGWQHAAPEQYRPLERELNALAAKKSCAKLIPSRPAQGGEL